MGIKKFRPYTPSRRHMTGFDFKELVGPQEPEKSLLEPLKKSGGRNARGRITSRHRGGGHKRRLRIIDFKRNRHDAPGKVIAIQYDPNRSARLALVEILPELNQPGLEVAFMAYGHRRANDCSNIELIFPPAVGRTAEIGSRIQTLNTLGKTPLAAAITKGGAVLASA